MTTREEIIKMAREAGILIPQYREHIEHLERFFHMAQAAERKRQALANEALDRKAENARELGLDYGIWQWNDAPIKTQWGHDMVVADLEIDKDHTVSVYCERDQLEKVEAMFRPQPAAQSVTYQLSPTDIYDFAGWLTTRKGVMTVGSSCEAGPMAEAVNEYIKTFPERFNVQPAAQCEYIRHTKDGTHWCALAEKTAAWVGLTDEEIKPICDENYIMLGAYAVDFIRAIEAKLKEKNT